MIASTSGVNYMAKEISAQPELWMETFFTILKQQDPINNFLNRLNTIPQLQIVLTGAGSSAFIGEILQNAFARNMNRITKTISTTDIVTHANDHFQPATPTLLISFARSGDSPESIATFEFAEKLVEKVYHLVITCNPEGALARRASGRENAFVLLLPEGANDKALAMTSSFTCMTLAGLLISDLQNIEQNKEKVTSLAAMAQTILDKYATSLDKIADLDFKRIVFLGSGPLKGAARESHLKVIELTDGGVICKHDSFLGFRHGPKAVINESTLLFYLFSNDPYVYQYEIDLVNSIDQSENIIYSIGIGQSGKHREMPHLDLNIDLYPGNNNIPDDFFSICSVIPAQILGFYKSLSLGLTPDSPSKNGGIHRVVQGVNIYPA